MYELNVKHFERTDLKD